MGLDVDVLRVGNDNLFQSPVFSSTIATLLDAQIEVVDTNGAIGAARAAGVAAGAFANLEEALKGIQPAVVYEPKLAYNQCLQSYNLWISCLQKALQDPTSSKSSNADRSRLTNQKLREDLLDKERFLHNLNLQLLAKDELLTSIKSEIQVIAQGKDGLKQQVVLRKLAAKIEENIDKKGSWKQFEQQFDLLHSQFIQRLHEKFPDLSTIDLKLAAFLRIRMSTKEIASLLNLSPRGVETQRYRLRKKLDIKGETDLIAFLEEQERHLY